jgi:cytochrome c oxidase subunit 2
MTHAVLNPAGLQARQLDQLWWLMFWVCLPVFVLVIAFLLAAVFRRRPMTLAGGRAVPNQVDETRMFRMVATFVGVTVVLLLFLMINSFATSRDISALTSSQPLTLEIVARQWWWEVHYADPSPARRVVTANEIHLPVGRPVLLKLSSHDVIHSFWVPALHGKRDLIPGQQNTFWIQADTPGVYEGQCAEYCGHQHAHMRILVFAETPEQFAAWYEAQLQPAVPPANEQLQHGQQVFLKSSCILCHTIQGTDAAASNGPNLTHIAGRTTLAAGTMPNKPQQLNAWIADPQKFKPGVHMPANGIPATDLDDLVGYLGSLK